VTDDLIENFPKVFTTIMSGAVISPDEKYRYVLWRVWDQGQDWMTFIMLNPSTADANEDDATIRRCKRFARDNDCGGLIVVNLFAYRATQPDDLLQAENPVGPDNKRWVENVISMSTGPVVAAWGSWWYSNQSKRHGQAIPRLSVEAIAKKRGVPLYCLGRTLSLQPRHPLYIPNDQKLEGFL